MTWPRTDAVQGRMRSRCPAALIAFLAVGSIAAEPAQLIDKRNEIEARATLDRLDVRLSGEVKLTLIVVGPAPLTVTAPRPLLVRANLWRVREDGPPLREVAGTHETWSQAYRLSPLVPGEPEITPGRLTVDAGGQQATVIDWNNQSLAVRVRTAIDAPTSESLRPATDIEALPPAPTIDRDSTPWLFAIVPALLLISAMGIYFGRRQRKALIPHDAAWANQELQVPNLSADRCAIVLRQYLACRYAIAAEARTTPELGIAMRGTNVIPEPCVAAWEALLDECDTARFAGVAARLDGLADRARSLIATSEHLTEIRTEGGSVPTPTNPPQA